MGNAHLARTSFRALVASLFLSAICLESCSRTTKTPGQLVVAVSTDMALPEQIDTIELQVIVNGTTLLDYPMPTGTGSDAQPIPATLTLVAGPDPSLPATIRVIGMHGSVARTLRQVVTTVPTEGTALLRMPVQWLCDGQTRTVTAPDGGVTVESECGADATCQAGRCVSAQVPSSGLPPYEPQSVFGGGAAPASKGRTTGACFDTIACMLSGTVEAPDDQCTVDFPSDVANVNVALRVADDGICDTTGTTCFVPLDGENEEGWTVQNGRIALPPAVCTKLRDGLVAGVVVSTTCATKTPATPPCGPWSSVKPLSNDAGPQVLPDAGASTVPALVASVVVDTTASTVCCPLMADSQSLYTCVCDASGAAQIVSIDPSSGKTAAVGSFTPLAPRSLYEAVLAGGNVYWVDRSGATCLVEQTPIDGGATQQLTVVDADIFDSTDLLADGKNLYALADQVAGLAPGASKLQFVRIDRMAGTVTPFDTGSAKAAPEFTQDTAAVYLGADTDVVAGDASFERISRIVTIPKAGVGSTTVEQRTLSVIDPTRGGFVGLADDGTSLFDVYEDAINADGTMDVRVEKRSTPSSVAKVVYEETIEPATTHLRLLGAVDGAALVVRDATQRSDAGRAAADGTVIAIPSDGSTPRIVASFRGDTPLAEMQPPTFTPDIFWLNQSGRVYRLSPGAWR